MLPPPPPSSPRAHSSSLADLLSFFSPSTQTELPLAVNQALALFIKTVRKLSSSLQTIERAAVSASLPAERAPQDILRKNKVSSVDGEEDATGTTDWKPMEKTVEEDLAEAGDEVTRKMREMQREMIDSMDLTQ